LTISAEPDEVTDSKPTSESPAQLIQNREFIGFLPPRGGFRGVG
jgi:hypothetical protein